MKKLISLFLMLMLASASLYAGGIPRPLIATDTQPLGMGRLLIEGGVDYLKSSADAKYTDLYFNGGFGLTPKWDVFVKVPYSSIDNGIDDSGLGDMFFETSYEITSDSFEAFGCSIGANIKLPTANDDKGLGTGKEDYTGYFVFSGRVFDALSVLDVSYTHRNEPEGVELDNFWEAVAELQFPVTPGSNISLAFLSDFYNERDNNYELIGGIDYYVNELSKLNLIIGTGLDDNSNDLRAGLNFQILF